MCICVVCISVYVYCALVHVCTYLYVYIRMALVGISMGSMCVCVYMCAFVHGCVCMCLCVYTCECIYMCTCGCMGTCANCYGCSRHGDFTSPHFHPRPLLILVWGPLGVHSAAWLLGDPEPLLTPHTWFRFLVLTRLGGEGCVSVVQAQLRRSPVFQPQPLFCAHLGVSESAVRPEPSFHCVEAPLPFSFSFFFFFMDGNVFPSTKTTSPESLNRVLVRRESEVIFYSECRTICSVLKADPFPCPWSEQRGGRGGGGGLLLHNERSLRRTPVATSFLFQEESSCCLENRLCCEENVQSIPYHLPTLSMKIPNKTWSYHTIQQSYSLVFIQRS